MALRLYFDMIFGVRELTLKEAFHVLFGIACANDAFVAAHGIFWLFHSEM
jgi:hypothetical protein